jgi:hypothetical protein
MGVRSCLSFTLALLGASACAESLPDKAPLVPEAISVEILNEPPNPDIYEPAGEARAQVIGSYTEATMREAFNMLRNQAVGHGATFVTVTDVSSRAAWDFSGRTVVTLVGTTYRSK